MLIEAVESAARRRPGAEVFALPLAGGVATYGGPGSPLNKVAGIGLAGPPERGAFDQVEQAYSARGVAVQVELSSLADPEVGAMLCERGYRLAGHENVLGLSLDPGGAARAAGGVPGRGEIEVLPGDYADFTEWCETLEAGFAAPDGHGAAPHEVFDQEMMRTTFADVCAAPGVCRYLARRSGVVAGGASMRIGEGIAQLCGAATLPAHRRRGVQAALLAKRLHDAARQGCDLAVVTTMPGSKSQENAQRRGFALLYARAILVRRPR